MRIHLIGTPGAGKTTLARRLAATHHIPYIELDTIYWQNNWQHRSPTDFAAKVQQRLFAPDWIVEGSYEEVNRLISSQADMVVWLDPPLPLALWRLFHRNYRCARQKATLWGTNNRETLQQLLGQDSIVRRSCQAYRQRRHTYLSMFRHGLQMQDRRTKIYRLTTADQQDAFCSGVIA